jgi:hypothetical protein
MSAASAGLGEVRIDDEVGYRTLSVLSIVSLILGLAAPLCLIAPLLFAIPIAGMVVALLAIGRIAASDGALIGRRAAVIALGLCVASMCASIVRSTLTQELLSRQARQAALEWFALLEAGDAEKALDMTVTSNQPPPPPHPGESAAVEATQSPLDLFRQQPVVRFLLDQADGARARYVQDLAYDPGVGGMTQIEQQFAVDRAQPTEGPSSALVQVTMRRTWTNGMSRWMVANSRSEDLPSNAL